MRITAHAQGRIHTCFHGHQALICYQRARFVVAQYLLNSPAGRFLATE